MTKPKKTATTTAPETSTTFVKTKKAFVRTEKLKVVKPKEPPIRTEVNEPLTQEHRKDLVSLINNWVTTSNLAKKPLHQGTAFTRLYDYGLNGAVNGIGQIEESEFETCRAFIKQRIMILESGDEDGFTRKKSDWTTRRITIIQAACKTNGISEERRKAYLKARWGVDSLLQLSDDQLEECRRYAASKPPPKWIPPVEETPGTQELREKALARLLDGLETNAQAKGDDFNRNALRVQGGKNAMLDMLASRDRTLFCDDSGDPISLDAFNKFWSRQKLCSIRSGRPRGSQN